MKELRMIKVIGIQKDNKGIENKIELITEGICYKKKNNVYIVYEESEISGMEGATTTIKIEGEGKVSMRRFGSSDMQLIFQKGKPYNSQYRTEFGQFEMKIYTNQLDVDLCNKTQKGSIAIQYDLWVAGLADTTNELNIQLI